LDLLEAKPEEEKKMTLTYLQRETNLEIRETICFKHLLILPTNCLVETCSSPAISSYERVWLVEPIKNSATSIRVTLFAHIPAQMHNMRNNGQSIVESICALKAFIDQEDKQIEQSN
jgi:hypothetical protein